MGLLLSGGIYVNSYREKVTLELGFETYVVGYRVGVEVGRVGGRCRNGEKQSLERQVKARTLKILDLMFCSQILKDVF